MKILLMLLVAASRSSYMIFERIRIDDDKSSGCPPNLGCLAVQGPCQQPEKGANTKVTGWIRREVHPWRVFETWCSGVMLVPMDTGSFTKCTTVDKGVCQAGNDSRSGTEAGETVRLFEEYEGVVLVS